MDLSIIIPVYNSSSIIKKLIKEISINIRKQIKYEIILINDSSLDNSWEIIKNLSKKFKFIKGINLKKNYGQHSAIFVGLKYAKGKKIITMDDDLQHPPTSIHFILNALNKYDLCYTLYLKRKHVFWKRTVSYLNNIFSSYLFNKSFKIYLSSYRGFNSKILPKFFKNKKKIIFIDSLLLRSTSKITAIRVKHKERYKGESNYNIKNLFSLWFDMIENYHFLPIRFGSFMGLLSFFFVKLIRITSVKSKKIEIKNKTFI
tara:strand:- start:627 stop:1403 length:777 start_codon:yes stop_codon:yes gene_type:complete